MNSPKCALARSVAVLFALWGSGAEAQSRFEGLASAGLRVGRSSSIDLAEIAGQSGYGEGNDAGPATLGFELGAGALFPIDLELDASAALSVGGLNLDHVEQRYLGTTSQPIGSTLTASADFAVLFAPLVTSGVRLLVGPAIGVERMAASSPSGAAHLDLVGAGLDAGFRIRTNRTSRVADGQLAFVLSGRRELPIDLRVARSENDVILSGTDGDSSAIYSFGVAAKYVFSFHAVE